ncbi:hypothetical protein MD535_11265 [Vibrio sp. ZSDZ65]|uniref:Transporter suffix domain-containing protein n=1 Tax=Vibrio qingdaonensis TaxID=2829491 RepID=A0A9X3CQ95_9VIBR|nr:hypothetical protein [Vibrio qingdaonensis]MCW8346575.1 hypothetical protein [Vibrio qingdaonensis]
MKKHITTYRDRFVDSARLFLGMLMLIIACASPLLIPVISTLKIGSGSKALLSGSMIFGVPELATLAAVMLLGKDRLLVIKNWVVEKVLKLKPQRKSTKLGYYSGLALMMIVGPIMNIALFYLPFLSPAWVESRQVIGAICDVTFIVALFMAGEQLWGKLEAIFSFDTSLNLSGLLADDLGDSDRC